MATVARNLHRVNFQDALLAAANRAMAASPQATQRIKKGLALVQADAVTDQTARMPRWFTVQSATDPETHYDVISNGTTSCTCPDYGRNATLTNEYRCKHGWAVLLVRAARRDYVCPAPRKAYHMASGEEGTCRFLADGRAAFHPGGHKHSFVCMRDELCIGPLVTPQGRPY